MDWNKRVATALAMFVTYGFGEVYRKNQNGQMADHSHC